MAKASRAARTTAPHTHAHAHAHGEHASHGFDRNRNPTDWKFYLERLEGADRAEWQQPDKVVRALRLARGQTVAEVGAGPGYFALRMAKKVGPTGSVFAVDVEPRMLEVLRERIASAKVRNVVPVLGMPNDPLLPASSCDRILLVNVLHHFEDPRGFLRRLGRALGPGGRLVNIDYHAGESPVGPPPEHRIARERFVAIGRSAGYEVDRELEFLPYQYFFVLQPR